LGVLGLGVIVTTLLTSLAAPATSAWGSSFSLSLWQSRPTPAGYFVAFRLLTPKVVRARRLLLGAVAGGAAWTALQALGAYLVCHLLYTDSAYGVFATVLGLLAWIYLGAEIAVRAAETNVVLARLLWPRSIVQPPLTAADRAVLAGQALQNQRRDDPACRRCRLMTRHPARRHPARRRRPQLRTSRPRSPTRAALNPPPSRQAPMSRVG
jgi:hypothetical protein